MDPLNESFPHSFGVGRRGSGKPPKVVDEMDIIKISIKIRENPEWDVKMNDPKIVAKWKEEIANRFENIEEKFDFVLKELGYYLSLRDGPVEVAAVDGTWQSDSLIDDTLREKFISGARVLEEVPDKYKDWHPRTNEQVLNLVNPSMYCFVQGKSIVLKNRLEFKGLSDQESRLFYLFSSPSIKQICVRRQQLDMFFNHTNMFDDYMKSDKHQWLPCEMEWNENGSIEIASYINNLHPDEHRGLYAPIQTIFEKFVPLFNKVLTDLRDPRPNRLEKDDYKKTETNNSNDDDTSCILIYDSMSDFHRDEEQNRQVEPRAVIPKFSPPEKPALVVDLKGKPLQVIVTLVNIVLTPEKPGYSGGGWHLEGMANERIVGTGIYYYSGENITESRLQFRQAIREPDTNEENTASRVSQVYDLQDKNPLNQELGSIVTKEGRCIAFPNTLQHRVAPFQLEDPTLPGHRKILVFFLIDPTVKVISTARVPPQQKSWYTSEIAKEFPALFPEEIADEIANMIKTDYLLMTHDEAKEVRDELMNERKFFIRNNNEEYFERKYRWIRRRRFGIQEMKMN